MQKIRLKIPCQSSTPDRFQSHDDVRWTAANCEIDYGHHFLSRIAGFTLLELLVVVAIIGMLAGYVGPKYFGQLGKAEIKAARAQIVALEKALDQYRLDTGRYPRTEQGLNVLIAKPVSEPRWAGPYLTKNEIPPDPWGRSYLYKCPGEHGELDLYSYGRDGRPGGSGEDADITNW